MFQVYALDDVMDDGDDALSALRRQYAAWDEEGTLTWTARLPLTARTVDNLAERLTHYGEVEYEFSLPKRPARPTGFRGVEMSESEQKRFSEVFREIIEHRKHSGLM